MSLLPTTFHLSINVSNLERAVAFYRVLFGLEPAKCHDDYAKFELAEPPVIFSLVPQVALAGGSLSRVGLRLADPEAVAEVQGRLEAAGITTQVPPGSCCSSPTRCYVADPDLNYWEITAGDDEGPPLPPPEPPAAARPSLPQDAPVIWEHFLAAPPPGRIPHADGSVEEVRLTGTFNAVLTAGALDGLLREVARVLRPGGKVITHALVGDRPFEQQPQLPGLAALVQRVPVQTEPIDALRAAGFVGAQFVKFSEKAWFQVNGVDMREIKLVAFKPSAATSANRSVTYRGPCHQAQDDFGNVYPRGQPVVVNAATAELLQRGAAGAQFYLPEEVPASGACCGAASS